MTNIESSPVVQQVRDDLVTGKIMRVVKTNTDDRIREVVEDHEAALLRGALADVLRQQMTPTGYDLMYNGVTQQITAVCGEDIDAFRALLWHHVNTARMSAKCGVNELLISHSGKTRSFACAQQVMSIALEEHPLMRVAYDQLTNTNRKADDQS